MDPITTAIVTATCSGLAKDVIKDCYSSLKATLKQKFGAESDVVDAVEKLGAGEIVVNSIDNDGVMKGYDSDLVRQLRNNTSVPISVLGGAGSLVDLAALIREFGTIGAVAGSLFVFKGVYRAVLINYPNRAEKDALLDSI